MARRSLCRHLWTALHTGLTPIGRGRGKNPRLNDFMSSLRQIFDRLRTRRLASTFVILATISAAILAGSYKAHGVHGQDKTDNSSDATPLKIPNSSVAPNAFAQIAKQVGPAVVNINTRTLPKDVGNRKQRLNPHGRVAPAPQSPDDDDQDGG